MASNPIAPGDRIQVLLEGEVTWVDRQTGAVQLRVKHRSFGGAIVYMDDPVVRSVHLLNGDDDDGEAA